MNNKRFSEKDYDMWCEDYQNNKRSFQRIADKYKDKYKPSNGPSKSLIRQVVENRGLTRTLSEAQEARTDSNRKGFAKGNEPWNKGMSETGTYPFPSPFEGKESPFKGIPRSKEDRAKISHSLRLQNRLHYGFYPDRANDPDKMYLLKINSDQEPFVQYKIGRTFNSLGRRFSWD